MVVKVVIEADHAVDVGAAEVERPGDQRLAFSIDATELGLDVVQDRQERPFAAFVRGDDLADALFLGIHFRSLSACHAMWSAMNVAMKKYE